ncbi:MAG: hypothetical protein M0026_04485 [Nocardiopsaceae bacterium]|nr:hypothetical protein [Nocardiopsaceae bacterium]
MRTARPGRKNWRESIIGAMLRFEPWLSRADHADARPVLRALLGASLTGVRYLHAEDDFWPNGHRHDDIHEVDMGVELTTAAGTRLVVSWAMDGIVQGLGRRMLPQGHEDPVRDSVEVGGMEQWRPRLGRTVLRAGLASHVAEDDCAPTYWSLRLEFDGGRSPVIALGEADEGGHHQPDALVVLFDEDTARGYVPVSSSTPAWGELVIA